MTPFDTQAGVPPSHGNLVILFRDADTLDLPRRVDVLHDDRCHSPRRMVRTVSRHSYNSWTIQTFGSQ
jgi:hypothetical protein